MRGIVMWAWESVFYQIYPLGLLGAPFENDDILNPRILRLINWIPHMKRLGITAVYICPVFQSDSHGYNTRDFKVLDSRLGTNDDFKCFCDALKEQSIRIVLDAVFHHVGRGFPNFQDVIKNGSASNYKEWFFLDFSKTSSYGDNFWYEGWEGNYDLVKLNLKNSQVQDYLLQCVEYWTDEFGLDGLRLDVAYSLEYEFVRRLRMLCNHKKQDFWLLGEQIHGDYNLMVNETMLHSATNYECYKGMYSSFNSNNLFEISHSLNRQFGNEDWCLYRGKHLFNFVDNHDVSRISSMLQNKNHVPLIYGLLFGIPGIPCIYYGSEWGEQADKSQGDQALRIAVEKPLFNELSEFIAKLAWLKQKNPVLNYGDYRSIFLTNKQCVFQRQLNGSRILIAMNIEEIPFYAHFSYEECEVEDLITNQKFLIQQGFEMEPYRVYFLQVLL